MEQSASNIDVTKDIWETMGENSKVFDIYLAQYMQLQEIFQKYQELVRRDVEDIKAIGAELTKMDYKFQSLWK